MIEKSQQLTPEVLVPRVGNYLVEKGVLSEVDLEKALAFQQTRLSEGVSPPLLGQILVEMGFLKQEVLDQAITEQIIQLRNALQEANQELENRVEERTIALEEALRKLSELGQLKSNFIANISHELRTPLTHIKGYIELLDSGSLGGLQVDQVMAVQVMQRASERLERLIDDLILFSVVERGKLELNFSLVDLRAVYADAINRSSSMAEDKGVDLVMNCPDDMPKVRADHERIAWVILQLLDNAIKFTPKNGSITLHAELAGEKIRVIVTDTGMGIPADKIDEIFEPFHQLDSSSTRKFSGTGLGLALARDIVETHGSQLLVDSTPGRGSSFYFVLDIYQSG